MPLVQPSTRKANRRGIGAVLSYRLKLFPEQCKSDMLVLLADHFRRMHRATLERAFAHVWANNGTLSLKGLSQIGEGKFAQRVMYRAFADLKRAITSARATRRQFKLPYLHPERELIAAATVQTPRRASAFDYWIHVEGLSCECQLYLPANSHRALNRALSYPGARLGRQAEIMRVAGAWYAYVFVHIPDASTYAPRGWLGCDVGVKKSVCTSDGKRGRDMQLVLARMKQRRADQQRRGIEKRENFHQRRLLNEDARRIVSVARNSGRGLAIEDPTRLIRMRQHAARQFGKRIILLARLEGIPVALVPPPWTSQTCHRCGSRESTVRLREEFWCRNCRILMDADVNAARTIARKASAFGRGATNRGACHDFLITTIRASETNFTDP